MAPAHRQGQAYGLRFYMHCRRPGAALLAILLFSISSDAFACTASCAPERLCPCCDPSHESPTQRASIAFRHFSMQGHRADCESPPPVRAFDKSSLESAPFLTDCNFVASDQATAVTRIRRTNASIRLASSRTIIRRSSQPPRSAAATSGISCKAPPLSSSVIGPLSVSLRI